jgi:hypothetical protein
LLPAINIFDTTLVEHIHINPNEYIMSKEELNTLQSMGISISNSDTNPYDELERQLLEAIKQDNKEKIIEFSKKYPSFISSGILTSSDLARAKGIKPTEASVVKDSSQPASGLPSILPETLGMKKPEAVKVEDTPTIPKEILEIKARASEDEKDLEIKKAEVIKADVPVLSPSHLLKVDSTKILKGLLKEEKTRVSEDETDLEIKKAEVIKATKYITPISDRHLSFTSSRLFWTEHEREAKALREEKLIKERAPIARKIFKL